MPTRQSRGRKGESLFGRQTGRSRSFCFGEKQGLSVAADWGHPAATVTADHCLRRAMLRCPVWAGGFRLAIRLGGCRPCLRLSRKNANCLPCPVKHLKNLGRHLSHPSVSASESQLLASAPIIHNRQLVASRLSTNFQNSWNRLENKAFYFSAWLRIGGLRQSRDHFPDASKMVSCPCTGFQLAGGGVGGEYGDNHM